MRKLFFITLLSLCSTVLVGQEATVDFFFGYKKSSLTAEHNQQLAEIASKFTLADVTIKIKSYCDSVGGPEYNVGLGQKRADLFVKYFNKNNVKATNISVENNGSTNPLVPNDSEENMAKNRKVVVEIYGTASAPLSNADATNDSTASDSVVAADPCAGDTLVSLADGAMFKMNKCEYLKLKDCMTIKAFVSAESLKESSYTTMGTAGQVMSTAGIIEFRTCADTALANEIFVYVPTKQTCKPAGTIDLWTSYNNNVWNARSKKADIDTIAGETYFVYKVRSSGTAIFASEQETTPEFQIKSKKGLKIKEVKVYYNCEKGVYHVKTEKPTKKVKMKLPCPTETIYFDIVGVDKKGNEYTITYASSEYLKKRWKQKECGDKTIKRKYYFYPTSTGVKE